MKPERIAELQKETCNQIYSAIKNDLDYGESVMKEVFENCDSQPELKVVYAEMKRIMKLIKKEGI